MKVGMLYWHPSLLFEFAPIYLSLGDSEHVKNLYFNHSVGAALLKNAIVCYAGHRHMLMTTSNPSPTNTKGLYE